MKKLVKNKNLIILILCFTIILLCIGFSLISIRLKEQDAEGKIYDVEIVNIQEGTAIKGGTVLPTGTYKIEDNGKTANFTFNLTSPKDTLTYIITIKNNGNLKAKIDGLAESPDYLNDNNQANAILPVIINHNDITNQELNPREEIKLTITVEFSNSGQTMNKTVPYAISILSSYVE
ncbi:MAG: hypothetical protein PUE33_02875 [bacterium]|nr:hypothetical protein [Mycoplasmatota bacterium]MDD6756995.1 hypothetical protein [bacterium]MDY2908387.1 hypothetical protein [Candidatus Faecimonas sp.]